jgi:hypothetical protein
MFPAFVRLPAEFGMGDKAFIDCHAGRGRSDMFEDVRVWPTLHEVKLLCEAHDV